MSSNDTFIIHIFNQFNDEYLNNCIIRALLQLEVSVSIVPSLRDKQWGPGVAVVVKMFCLLLSCA